MLFVLVIFLALVAAAGWFVVKPRIEDFFADPADYDGPGHGKVTVVIDPGQTIQSMGDELTELGVVASAEAFVDAAAENPDAPSIQAGTYVMQEEMSAEEAVSYLIDPDNMAQVMVTVPEGLRVVDIVDLLAKKTDFGAASYQKVLDEPDKLGLPSYAKGDPEGYLFPATYPITPADTPTTILRSMVDRWRQSAESLDLEGSAEALGYTPAEIMTVASLVEAEGRGDDMPKIARVIYNRLENRGTAGTVGLLQIDATVNYALGRQGTVALTTDEIQTTDSPYNTYLYEGLPPGPIEAPGEDAIDAALHPEDGDWYYYVTVNLKTGETKFASTPEEFATYKAEYLEYCETSDAC